MQPLILSSFDSYLLAANCAQFPLPIITGIGHERDDTVLDIVAHTRAKTPTAVAEFLIKHIYESASELIDIQDSIIFETNKRLIEEATILNTLVTKYSYIIKDRTKDQLNKLDIISEKIKNAAIRVLQDQKHILESKEQYIEHNSPENILKKGYTLTLSGKKIIKSKAGVKKGDNIVTRFADGEVKSLVK